MDHDPEEEQSLLEEAEEVAAIVKLVVERRGQGCSAAFDRYKAIVRVACHPSILPALKQGPRDLLHPRIPCR